MKNIGFPFAAHDIFLCEVNFDLYFPTVESCYPTSLSVTCWNNHCTCANLNCTDNYDVAKIKVKSVTDHQ